MIHLFPAFVFFHQFSEYHQFLHILGPLAQ